MPNMQYMQDQEPKQRLGYMDGLRAIAVISVAISHFDRHTPDINPLKPSLFNAGIHGVDLFFVISGFCLAYPYLLNLRNSKMLNFCLPIFYAKRIVRILPPYYVAIVILSCIAVLPINSLFLGVGETTGLRTILNEFALTDYKGLFQNGSFWTLAIEFRWYLLFPLFLILYEKSSRYFYVLLIGILFYIPLTRASNVDMMFLPYFLSGIIAADASITRPRWTKFSWIGFLISMYLAITTQLPNPEGYFLGPFWGIASFCLVICAGRYQLLQRLLSLPGLKLVGIASYSIYLIHEPIIIFCIQALHFSRIPAVLTGVTGGIVYWYLVERIFLSNPLRGKMIDSVYSCLERLNQGMQSNATPRTRASSQIDLLLE